MNGEWEDRNSSCTNHISFGKDGSFSNWCSCGSPVGDGDMIDEYRYNNKDKTVSLYSDGEIYETGKVLFVDKMYLIISLWEKLYVYQNTKDYSPEYHEIAAAHINDKESVKPCLTVLGYENDTLTVSSYNYDGDSKKLFNVWKLKADPNITFKDVSIKVENDAPTITVKELKEEDYQYVGEYYTGGYLEIDQNGIVKSIVFYGELIIH